MTITMFSNGYLFPRDYALSSCPPLFPNANFNSQCKANAKALGIDPDRIVVAGGSAGGNLAAVLAQVARDEGDSGIIGQVLNGPVTCHPKYFPKEKFEYTSWEQNKDASILPVTAMMKCWNSYLPNAEPTPRASPLLAESFLNLPPARTYSKPS